VIRFVRIAFAVLIAGAMAAVGTAVIPPWWKSRQLTAIVEGIAQSADSATRPDDALKLSVVEKARDLGLPLTVDNVRIDRRDGRLRIETRYDVLVDLPYYTVRLHFYRGTR
jgi:hypothetical protein